MGNDQTVRVERIAGQCAIQMTWERNVEREDVRAAFQRITQLLRQSEEDCYVVVDIRSDPRFPLADTVVSALAGPFRDPKLLAWLIMGNNALAQKIEGMLTKVTGRQNVLWFEDEEEVFAYLQQEAGTKKGTG